MKEFKLNIKDFEKKLTKLVKKTIPDITIKGMAKAGMQLLNDCIMQAPTVPIKEGTLRGSGSVFVQNKLIGVTPKINGKGTPNKTYSEALNSNKYTAIVGFNTPYAAKVHEKPMRFRENNAGNKYLESKIIRNKSLYMKIVADEIKAGGK